MPNEPNTIIDLDQLECVSGGDGVSGDTLFNFFAPIVANGVASFAQSVLLGGSDPVADGIFGLIKGATANTGGPVNANTWSTLQDQMA